MKVMNYDGDMTKLTNRAASCDEHSPHLATNENGVTDATYVSKKGAHQSGVVVTFLVDGRPLACRFFPNDSKTMQDQRNSAVRADKLLEICNGKRAQARGGLKEARLIGRPLKTVAARAEYQSLAKEVLKQIHSRPAARAVDVLACAFAKVSAEAQVSAAGTLAAAVKKPEQFFSKVASTEKAPSETGDPLAAARARGRRFALEMYDSPDNLGLLEARDYAGRNERSINEERQKGALYALLPPGKTRGFRYPKWQFDAEPDRLKAALRPFVDAKSNCWVIHSFMVSKRDALRGRSPREIVLDVKEDVNHVVDLAVRDLVGDQGAI
ncbi:hypothetical protein [Trinickia dinghuensis]|nr:hypothetical protein [Trinickia dinghuensis]